MRRFVVICCFRNAADKLDVCLRSIADQQWANFTAVLVDDASTDESSLIAERWAAREGWMFLRRTERVGAVVNQHDAILLGCESDDDVIVFVDGDDRLARVDTFQILDGYYEKGAQVTFGSYRPDPPDAGCEPAKPYRRSVVRQNAYRRCAQPHSYNHLRTFTFGIFHQMDPADFCDDRGEWFQNTPDAVMMFPALELARGDVWFVPEVLLVYSSDRESAEWRDHPEKVNYVNRTVMARPPK